MIEGLYRWHDGDGWTVVIAFDRGRSNISLLEIGTLKIVRRPATALRYGKPLPLKPRHCAKLIEDRRRALKRYGVRHRARTIKDVTVALRSLES